MSEQIFFKGDEVKHLGFGLGVVVDYDKDSQYPVSVKFNNRFELFMDDGRWFDSANHGISLSFRDGGFNYGTPPERKWIPTEACWANVWDEKKDRGTQAWVVGYDSEDPYKYRTTKNTWKHAEPCDPPRWEGE